MISSALHRNPGLFLNASWNMPCVLAPSESGSWLGRLEVPMKRAQGWEVTAPHKAGNFWQPRPLLYVGITKLFIPWMIFSVFSESFMSLNVDMDTKALSNASQTWISFADSWCWNVILHSHLLSIHQLFYRKWHQGCQMCLASRKNNYMQRFMTRLLVMSCLQCYLTTSQARSKLTPPNSFLL